MELKDLLTAVQGGGNIALLICAWFIYRTADRLSRIEKALDKYMKHVGASE